MYMTPDVARMASYVVAGIVVFLGVVYAVGRIWHRAKYTELASKLKSLRKEK